MIKNALIIDRRRYEQIYPLYSFSAKGKGIRGINTSMIQMLDYFIVEEEDDSATFIKNRYNNKSSMTKEEYDEFKQIMLGKETPAESQEIDIEKALSSFRFV